MSSTPVKIVVHVNKCIYHIPNYRILELMKKFHCIFHFKDGDGAQLVSIGNIGKYILCGPVWC